MSKMPIDLLNSIASWFLKKRIHQIELFIKYPNEVQNELLFNLLKTAKHTEIGKKLDFKAITNYNSFKENVPIVSYEDVWKDIDRSRNGETNIFWPSPIKWFAKSSGTTNAKSKFIPVSEQSLEDCHYNAGKDMLCMYLNNNENSNLFTGKSLRLGGSKELYKENGTIFGDLSAILIENLPIWAEYSSTPSTKTSLMGDWEYKMEAIARETINENVTSMAGVPSWMLVLLNTVLEKTNSSNILEIWPNLEVYFHGGINFNPYRSQYQNLIPSSNFQYYETYNASEGFFAIQDLNNSNDLLLMLDYGVFYEFIPMDTYGNSDEKIIPLSEVELNKNYAIIITTNAGLWRYKIGDTVKFTSLSPYRIRVTGRTKHYINAFGEELIIENTEEALKAACIKTNSEVKEYTVAPIFMDCKSKGSHEWFIDFKKHPDNLNNFSKVLDETLKQLNSDYEAKRNNNITLEFPKIEIAKNNEFYNWLKNNNKLGGQHKIPRLSNNRDFIENLKSMTF